MSTEILLQAAPGILSEAGAANAEVIGVLLYGSRESGHHRPDSDVDGLVLFRHPGELTSFEYHGRREGVPFEVELKFRTEEALREEIDERDLLRMVSVATGRIAHDPHGILEGLQLRARAALEIHSGSVMSGLAAGTLLSLLQLTAVELRSALLAVVERTPFAAAARLAEFLVDFHLYTEILVRLRQAEEGLAAPPLGTSALLATGSRTARLLQTEKFVAEPWFTGLVAEVEAGFPFARGEGGAFIENIFTSLDRSFRSRVGHPLLEVGKSALLKG